MNNKAKQRFKKDQEFYEEIWNDRQHYCVECYANGINNHLGDELNRYFMAHIWSKGSNNHFRHDPRNIVILCPNHHNQLDAKQDGKTRHDMTIWPHLEDIITQLKKEYYDRS